MKELNNKYENLKPITYYIPDFYDKPCDSVKLVETKENKYKYILIRR